MFEAIVDGAAIGPSSGLTGRGTLPFLKVNGDEGLRPERFVSRDRRCAQ